MFFFKQKMAYEFSACLVGSEMCIRDFFFFQAEDGIRDRSPSRGLGDVYKRQPPYRPSKEKQEQPRDQPYPKEPLQ